MAGLSNSRRAAHAVLSVARERDAYVRELLNSPACGDILGRLSEEDRAFARRLCLGVTATSGVLDELVDRYVARPERLDPEVRDVLRIATYEMAFLGKSPHAAVSQGVELVKTCAKSASGLVNAVLRRVSENVDAFMGESAAHRFGLPAWLLDRVAAQLGDDAADAFGRAYLEPAPVFVANVPMWVSDKRAQEAFAEAGLAVRAAGSVPGSWVADDPAAVPSCQLVKENQAVVADYGAQAVAFLAAPEPGDRLLEVGSGRGTKTVLMAGHTHRQGGAARVWALDVHEYKARLAERRLEEARVAGVVQVTGDACDLSGLASLPPLFDRILVDAPCTGTGTLRRRPEIAWSLSPDDVASCAALQLAMLRSVAPRLAAGGVLSYATCSVLREEDEDVVAAFLASPEGAGFEIVPVERVAASCDASAGDELAERSCPEGFMRTVPAPGECDGHFCACLVKRG